MQYLDAQGIFLLAQGIENRFQKQGVIVSTEEIVSKIHRSGLTERTDKVGQLRLTASVDALESRILNTYFKGQIEIPVRDYVRKILESSNAIDDLYFNDKQALNGLELDLYIPTRKIAIEVNEEFWHGSRLNGKAAKYHRNKLTQCTKRGIELAFVWELEWRFDSKSTLDAIEKFVLSNGQVSTHSLKKISTPIVLDRGLPEGYRRRKGRPADADLGILEVGLFEQDEIDENRWLNLQS